MDRSKMKWWDKFCELKRYSFLKDHNDAVCKIEDGSGAWVEQYEAAKLIDEMQSEINALESENNALKRRLEMVRNKFV